MGLPDLEVVPYSHDTSLRVASIAAGPSTETEFLRPVLSVFNKRFRDTHDNDLRACLDVVDTYLSAQAAAINAEVVPHKWVLIDGCDVRTSSERYGTPTGLSVFGLKGLWLGAKVKKVEGVPILLQQGFHISDITKTRLKLEQERLALHESLGWSIMELTFPKQYLSTSTDLSRSTKHTVTLVDIDILM